MEAKNFRLATHRETEKMFLQKYIHSDERWMIQTSEGWIPGEHFAEIYLTSGEPRTHPMHIWYLDSPFNSTSFVEDIYTNPREWEYQEFQEWKDFKMIFPEEFIDYEVPRDQYPGEFI